MTTTDHLCPGDCGNRVVNDLFACRECWYRLPIPMRYDITRHHRTDPDLHAHAMADAIRWYRTHPLGGHS
jgi:hypothetical protein